MTILMNVVATAGLESRTDGKDISLLARRSGDKWFVVGINADKQPLKKTVTLPMFEKNSQLTVYSDDAQLQGSVKQVKQNKKQQLTVVIPTNGGIVINN